MALPALLALLLLSCLSLLSLLLLLGSLRTLAAVALLLVLRSAFHCARRLFHPAFRLVHAFGAGFCPLLLEPPLQFPDFLREVARAVGEVPGGLLGV